MHKSKDYSQCYPLLPYNISPTFPTLQIVFVSTRTPGEMVIVKNGSVDVMRDTFTSFNEGHDSASWLTESRSDMKYDISMGTKVMDRTQHSQVGSRGSERVSTLLPSQMTYEYFKHVIQCAKYVSEALLNN